MYKIKNFLFKLFLISIFFFTITIQVQANKYDKSTPLNIYKGDIGLEVISYSKNWATQKKLKQVYDELLNNFHSEEIYYLSKIYIYPDSPEGVAGYYYDDYGIENGKYVYHNDRYIEIFNGDEYNDIADFARILAHEYGHHFTFYYLITKENKSFADWSNTKYAKIRNFEEYPQVSYYNSNDINYEHKWDISEIAAEDYVQLFGSPLAKKSVDYKDTKERVEQNIDEYYYYSRSFNLLPQENLDIPLAAEVKGLYNYWLNLAGYTTTSIKKIQSRHLRLTKTNFVYKDYKQYVFEWEPVKAPKNEIYEYTLVMYPIEDDSFPRPIKTVYTGEKMMATFGSSVCGLKNQMANAILEKYNGKYIFRLFVKNPDGFIFSTDVLKINFSKNGYVQVLHENIDSVKGAKYKLGINNLYNMFIKILKKIIK